MEFVRWQHVIVELKEHYSLTFGVIAGPQVHVDPRKSTGGLDQSISSGTKEIPKMAEQMLLRRGNLGVVAAISTVKIRTIQST